MLLKSTDHDDRTAANNGFSSVDANPCAAAGDVQDLMAIVVVQMLRLIWHRRRGFHR